MIEVRVTVPDEILNVEKVRREIVNELKRTQLDMQSLFRKTTNSWDTRVEFQGRVEDSPTRLSARVWTNNPIYGLVNAGAPRHTIRPRRARLLRFQTGYRPKSKPRVLGSFSGGKFGDWAGGSRGGVLVVNHPGFEAREFDQAVADEIGPKFEERIQEAIARGST